MSSELKCAKCKDYLFFQPMQCPCGDRLCGKCYQQYKDSSKSGSFPCPLCKSEHLLSECFRDRAFSMELKKATIQCTSPDCSWEGRSEDFKEHLETCQLAIIPCPHISFGCKEQLPRSKMSVHVNKCKYMPIQCKWCKEYVRDEEVHLKNGCSMVPEYCGNGCGEQIAKKDMEKHMRTMCTHQLRACDYKEDGCQFMGLTKDLNSHYKEQCGHHTQLMKQTMKRIEQSMGSMIKTLTQQNADLKAELNSVKLESATKLQPVMDAVRKADSSIQYLQEGFSEMALMVQILQATSYNGVLVWKIPEIQRRQREARRGQSLHSPPFYTEPFGYKLCLRLYLHGEGRGQGAHLSLLLVVMRGEHDAILPWPFPRRVTLTLLGQDQAPHSSMTFTPDPCSSSFQRPRSEMNVASGCPMIIPTSILRSPCYSREDTIFLKCKIEGQKTLKIAVNMD